MVHCKTWGGSTVKRLLFVDENPQVLQGFQQVFGTRGPEWQVYFAASANDAAAMLRSYEVDIVVMDIYLSNNAGIKLLEYLRENYPGIIRVAITSDKESTDLVAKSRCAHRYFTKPVSLAGIEKMIERVYSLQDMLHFEETASVIGSLKYIPSIPPLYSALIEAAESESIDEAREKQIFRDHPNLAKAVLAVASSSLFGFEGKINTLQDAVSLLGIEVIRTLTLVFSLSHTFDGNSEIISTNSLTEHSLITAVFARAILASESGSRELADRTFTAAALHDFGELLFATNFGDKYSGVIDISQANDRPLWEVEKEVIGTSHAEAGAYILGLWGLPSDLVEAIAYHHSPHHASPDAARILATLHIADVFCYEFVPDFIVGGLEGINNSFLESLNLSDRWGKWHGICDAEMKRIGYNQN